MSSQRVVLFISLLLFSSTNGWAKLADSAHDFTKMGWNGSESCVACHIPQNSGSAQKSQRWNLGLKSNVFNLYAKPDRHGQPGGSSKLCLSCHDGVQGSDTYARTNLNKDYYKVGKASSSVRLGLDHPVSIPYNHKVTSLKDAKKAMVTIGLQRNKTKTGSIQRTLLTENTIQCSSCHDVHNNYTAAEPLLVVTPKSGKLCRSCHDDFHQGFTQLDDFHEEQKLRLAHQLEEGVIHCYNCHAIHEKSEEPLLSNKIKVTAMLCLGCHTRK